MKHREDNVMNPVSPVQVGRSDRWECGKSVRNVRNRYRITAVDMPFKKFKLNAGGQVDPCQVK